MTQKPEVPAHKRKISFLRTTKAILWSFVGLRSRTDYEKDIEQLNPVHIVFAGLIGGVIFVVSLVLLAMWVAGK